MVFYFHQTDMMNEETKKFVSQMVAKDILTVQHSLQVYFLVKEFYDELPQYIKERINIINLINASLLHDVGKLLTPDEILKKTGKLNIEEKEVIKKHAEEGKIILENTKFKEIADIVCYHHERIDGGGYFGLCDIEIPLESKIISIVDTFSALTSNRVYRKGCSDYEAIDILYNVSGTQLDGTLVDIFCDMMKKKMRFKNESYVIA